jgi:enoyl-[acyl-carrier protein] reductase II
MNTQITQLFGIQYPIVQGGMVWCSGWELASAVSNAGGLGLIGSGSMQPEVLREHIRKTKAATNKPFGVNVPLLYSQIEKTMEVIMEEGVQIVFTSAGNPATWTQKLKDKGIKVVHVVSNVKFAQKCQDVGVDAIVAEGVEAGGHNGREETTTMVLIPLIKKHVNIPVIAAGGIATGQAMAAAFALGADGVQMGTRFAASSECSAHEAFKQQIVAVPDGGTYLALRKKAPVRLIRNTYANRIEEAENNGQSLEQVLQLVGKGRSKLGMFEGDLNEGELEIGQAAALIDNVQPCDVIMQNIINDYNQTVKGLKMLD